MRFFNSQWHVKKLVIGVMLTVVFFVLTSDAAEVARVGTVDVQRIFQSSEGGKKVEAEIRDQFGKLQADLQKKGDEIEELRKQFERESLVMDKSARDEKQRDLRIRTNDFQALRQRYNDDLKDVEAKLTSRIQKEILRHVEKIGKEQGYTVILDARSVLYSISAIDLTDQLIPLITAASIKLE